MQFIKTQRQRGITLIALIITIIVLVILAAVAINVALDSGIIGFATKGVKDYAEAGVEENKMMNNAMDFATNTIGEVEGILGGNGYTKVGETYCNEPDLSGFNPDCTKYVTYEGNTETIGSNIQLDANKKATNMPEGWYDYGAKKWANIVTENGDLKTYWVWIPRYEYKLDAGNQTADIKFVTKENKYIEISEEKEEEKTLGAEYKLPEAFTFVEDLSGYWISKYDVQEAGGKYKAESLSSPKVSATVDTFFENIRQMEAEGGTLGLKAKINQTTFLEEDGSNGLDCHMIKNTEWGPIVMLTVSQYGNIPTSATSSSTGNNTGVFHLTGSPYCYTTGVYSGASKSYITKLMKADGRYRDEYTSTGRTGDATTETNGWYSGDTVFVSSGRPVFYRGYVSVFGYHFSSGSGNYYYVSRAVVVCGAGL